jgi:hypothetical protein
MLHYGAVIRTEYLGSDTMAIPKFALDQFLYNRNTNESGIVTDVYEQNGESMYTVSIRNIPWANASKINVRSDWAERVLELKRTSD